MEHTSTRRRFFKRAGLVTLIGGLGTAVGFRAFAHGRHGMAGPMNPAMFEQHLDRMLRHVYAEIDATEEQKRRLEPILKDAARELAPLHEKFHAGRKQAIELLTQERIDAAAVESLRAEQLRLVEDGSRRISRALTEAAEVLTPAQRRDLAVRLERRRRQRWA